jgi:hypothetical protein
MGLWQPFGVGSTARSTAAVGQNREVRFSNTNFWAFSILSTWHGIFCFILLNILRQGVANSGD